jgi:hypothetical protein
LVQAKHSLRTIESAEKQFRLTHGKYATLEQLATDRLISGDLAKGIGGSYRFEIRIKDDGFAALAIPVKSDQDYFLPAYYMDETGVLRQNKTAPEANANDERAPET